MVDPCEHAEATKLLKSSPISIPVGFEICHFGMRYPVAGGPFSLFRNSDVLELL